MGKLTELGSILYILSLDRPWQDFFKPLEYEKTLFRGTLYSQEFETKTEKFGTFF